MLLPQRYFHKKQASHFTILLLLSLKKSTRDILKNMKDSEDFTHKLSYMRDTTDLNMVSTQAW